MKSGEKVIHDRCGVTLNRLAIKFTEERVGSICSMGLSRMRKAGLSVRAVSSIPLLHEQSVSFSVKGSKTHDSPVAAWNQLALNLITFRKYGGSEAGKRLFYRITAFDDGRGRNLQFSCDGVDEAPSVVPIQGLGWCVRRNPENRRLEENQALVRVSSGKEAAHPV